MAPQSMRSNGIYADYEKMAAEGGHRSQGGVSGYVIMSIANEIGNAGINAQPS